MEGYVIFSATRDVTENRLRAASPSYQQRDQVSRSVQAPGGEVSCGIGSAALIFVAAGNTPPPPTVEVPSRMAGRAEAIRSRLWKGNKSSNRNSAGTKNPCHMANPRVSPSTPPFRAGEAVNMEPFAISRAVGCVLQPGHII